MISKTEDEIERDDSAVAELMGFDKWPRDVSLAFDRALGVVSLKCVKNRKNLKNDFASVVAEFRAVEAEYLVRIGDNAENVQQIRRIITESLLQAAWDTDQPFETCQGYWNDLVQLGFYRIERQVLITGVFALCCREHGQTEIGLGVLAPLIVELERLCAEPSVTACAAEYYEERLVSLRKLRAKLETQQARAS